MRKELVLLTQWRTNTLQVTRIFLTSKLIISQRAKRQYAQNTQLRDGLHETESDKLGCRNLHMQAVLDH